MNENDWQLLKMLHKEKSITKTANKFYISQPALTYRLAKMEKEMDTQLFIRSTKGISYTSAGERLLTYADKMIRQNSDIKEYVSAGDGIVKGTLRLGSSAVFAHTQLPLLLKEFQSEYPLVTLSLHTGLSNEILQQMYKEEISVAIIRGDHPWKGADIFLQDEPLCIIAAKPLAFDDMPNTPSIYYDTDPTMQYQIDRWWQENFSVPQKILMHADSVYTCRQLVMAGLGWSIMPALRLSNLTTDLFVKEIRNPQNQLYKRPTRLIYNDMSKKNDVTNVFINFICAKFSITTQR